MQTRPEPQATRPDWTLAYLVMAGVGGVALLALLTAPVAELLGDSKYAIPATLHGISSMIYVIIGTILAYMAYLLYTDKLERYHDLQVLTALGALFSFVTVVFGNWIYIYYRATGGPREYFLETEPVIHEYFFEFKEYVALFTLPLSWAAAVIVNREKEHLRARPLTRQAVAVLLVLAWIFLMLAFGLGAAVTKLRSV
jgi:hypothetical protein